MMPRLTNPRIHANFNCHLCMSVTKACTHADAPDYGMLLNILQARAICKN